VIGGITARDLLQSLVYPSISFSGDFHCSVESRVCSEETEISVPNAVFILGEVHEIAKDQPTRITRKCIPPLHEGLRVSKVIAITVSINVELRVIHHCLAHQCPEKWTCTRHISIPILASFNDRLDEQT
jgi:hypothetical protein